MTRWSKVRAVAAFEFLSTVKRVGYLVTTFGMPVFILLYGGVISLIGLFVHEKENEVKIYGLVDPAGIVALEDEDVRSGVDLPEDIRRKLESLGERSPLGSPVAWWENFVFRPYTTLDAARQALIDDEIKGVYVIPADYMASGRVELYAREAPDLTGSESRGALRDLLVDRLLEGRVAEEVAERVRDPIAESVEWTVDASGAVEPRSVVAVLAKLLVPLVFTMLFFISLMMSAGYLLRGTAVEKENKVVEVLLSSARPEEIMSGKLLGLGTAGLLQVCVWFGMVLVGGLVTASSLELGGVDMPWAGMVAGVPFFLAGYLFLGSLMLGTGSLGGNMRESQQLSLLWTMLTIVPLVFMQILIVEPAGTLGRVLIWIPFTAPVTVILRMTLDPTGTAWWEVAGSFAMMLLATWLAIRLGARLFRVGLLLTGARPKLREIIRQARLST